MTIDIRKDDDGNIISVKKIIKLPMDDPEYEVVAIWEKENSKLTVIINDALGDPIEGLEIQND